jgi:hypothetical protein
LNPSNAWAGAPGPVLGDLDFDLGNVYSLGSFAFWSQSNTNAINSFTLFSAFDASFSGAVDLGTFSASVLNPITVQVFSAPSTAQFVRLRVNSNHGGNNVNIGEVAFDVSAAVPSPGPLALMGLGIAGIGYWRRKQI